MCGVHHEPLYIVYGVIDHRLLNAWFRWSRKFMTGMTFPPTSQGVKVRSIRSRILALIRRHQILNNCPFNLTINGQKIFSRLHYSQVKQCSDNYQISIKINHCAKLYHCCTFWYQVCQYVASISRTIFPPTKCTLSFSC